ncbi:MAG TPA: hypothetical protein VMM92_13400, partial [Thermoanaerobaculia bacterium]|nr:hypothetical protein [Thermoanaerobaculia bacterium]
ALYARADWTELGRYFAPYVPAAFLLAGWGALAGERAVLAGDRSGRRLRLGGLGLALAGVALCVVLSLLGAMPQEAATLGRLAAPVALALLWAGALEVSRRRRSFQGLAPLALAVAVAASGMVATVARRSPTLRQTYPGYILTSATLVPPALWMRDHLPAGAVIASRRIGALGYFSGHPVFDYSFGLTEREVARRIRAHGGPFDDPGDPALADLWQRRRPDYLLEEGDLVRRLSAVTLGAEGGGPPSAPLELRLHGRVYRVCRGFPIGRGVDWVLAGLADDKLSPCFKESSLARSSLSP